jgi:phospholipid-binding lipoprotein MlaA
MSQLWGKGHNLCCPEVDYPGTKRVKGARLWVPNFLQRASRSLSIPMNTLRPKFKLLLSAIVTVMLSVSSVQAGDTDELSAFGGSAYPNLLIDSDFASGPLYPEEQVPLLLADTSTTLIAQADEDDVNDPLESINRVVFGFNEFVYGLLLDPIADTYNSVLPQTLRMAISNLLDHLSSPVSLVNNLLQLEVDRAMLIAGRFVVNTVAGMGGIADVAASIGMEEHKEDFGQTMGAYGVGEGFYLVLPLMGPSNPRDAIGRFLVDPYFDPLGLYLSNTERDAARWSRIGVSAVDEYAGIVDELRQVKKTSVDYYAVIRSLYRQRRSTLISNGNDDDLPQIPNYDLNYGLETDGVAGVK